MKYDTPVASNPIDQLKVVGRATDRIEGPLKTTGTAPYAYERHDVVANPAYGVVVGAAIAKGRIASIDLAAAKAAPGVLAVVTAATAGKLDKGNFNTAHLLGGPAIEHYHQAVALVVADTFEQARAAAALVRVEYVRDKGAFDLAAAKDGAPLAPGGGFNGSPETKVGDFAGAFASAAVKLDATYTTPDQLSCPIAVIVPSFPAPIRMRWMVAGRWVVLLNIIGRVSATLTGRPAAFAPSAASTASARTNNLPPNPPPT